MDGGMELQLSVGLNISYLPLTPFFVVFGKKRM
jgi:hypothetical protein